jgi:hypothetical protein
MIKPKIVTNLDVTFGEIKSLLPEWDQIPKEFKDGYTRWNRIVSRWFFIGLPKETEFIPKEGINTKEALRHIVSILRSFDPKHEHKEAGCAYLLSLWFDDVIIPEKEELK